MRGTHAIDTRVRFVGRENELRCLQGLFASGGALTLIGPGGVGKSRLAYEAARTAELDGREVVFVALAGTAPEAVVGKVAATLETREEAGRDPLDVIHERLKGQPLILILDNCEHAPDQLGALIERLQTVPQLAVIATSQRRLDYPNEDVVEVHPFDRETGTAFLIARAENAHRRIGDDDIAVAYTIVEALDGLAIAIDLAAAKLSSLSLRDLAREVEELRPYDLRMSSAPERRHRSINKVVEWSTSKLDAAATHVLLLASLFCDTFDASDVTALADSSVTDTELTLQELSERSLLLRVDEKRFAMLAPIRAVMSRTLTSQVARRKIDERFALRMNVVAQELQTRIESAEAGDSVKRLVARYDDFCVALVWAMKRPTERLTKVFEIITALTTVWADGGRSNEGSLWIDRFLGEAGSLDQKLLGRISNAAMRVAHAAANFDQMLALAPGAISAFTIANDPLGLARAYNAIAVAALHAGNIDQAEGYVETAIALYTTVGHERGIGAALTNSGSIALEGRNDPSAAKVHYERAIEILERTGPDALIGIAHGNLAEALYFLRDSSEAQAHAECAIQYFRRTQAEPMIAWQHEMIARCSLLAHKMPIARANLESALEILTRSPQPLYLATAVEGVVRWLNAQRRFDEAAPLSFAAKRFRRERRLVLSGPAATEVRADEERIARGLGAEATNKAAASASWIDLGELATVAFSSLGDL